jgi:hypothetical protein
MSTIQLKHGVAAMLAALIVTAFGALPAHARTAADAHGVTYGGMTSAKWPVMVQLSRDGRKVTYALAAWATHCTDGSYSDTEEFEQIPISASGKFATSYDTGDYQQDSATVRYAASIKGKLNRRRSKIAGTVRVMLSVKDSANGVDYTCDTGTIKYTLAD